MLKAGGNIPALFIPSKPKVMIIFSSPEDIPIRDFLMGLVETEYNSLKATSLFYEHQISLPEELRICDQAIDLVEELKKLKYSLRELTNCKESLLLAYKT